MSNSTSSGGIGFVGLLAIALIVLKLTGSIDWSWWWVWSPVLIAAGISLVVIVIATIIMLAIGGKD
jgi:hypothetical protein